MTKHSHDDKATPDPAVHTHPQAPGPTTAKPHPGGGGDASLTGREPRTSRNQMTSDGADTPAGAAAPAKAEKPAAKAKPTVLETYPDIGNGTQEICLDGGGGANQATYLVGKPIPQDLTVGQDTYNLSDRVKGIYTYRVR